MPSAADGLTKGQLLAILSGRADTSREKACGGYVLHCT